MTKTWSGAPFGSSSNRFNTSGLHPNLLVYGHIPYESTVVTSTSKNLGPGSYELLPYGDFSERNVTVKAEGPNWETALYTEKMASVPHLLFKDTYYERKENERRLGPGYYNIKDGLDLADTKPRSMRGMLDALSSRFPDASSSVNPGPGAYGVPDSKIEEKKWSTLGGKVPLFERSKEERSLPLTGCDIAPGRYDHKSSIDELLKKKVSKRGPYDLFSINRSDPPKTGHFTKVTKWNLGPGQYSIPSFVDDQNSYNKVKHGKFGKIDQYPVHSGDRLSIEHTSLQPKNPDFPGPGYYTPTEIQKVKSNLPPFLISTSRTDKRSQKFFSRNYNPVGVGRYDIQRFQESEDKNCSQSVFVSKTSQITDTKQQQFYKERLKPHNLSEKQKRNLYLSGSVQGRIVTA